MLEYVRTSIAELYCVPEVGEKHGACRGAECSGHGTYANRLGRGIQKIRNKPKKECPPGKYRYTQDQFQHVLGYMEKYEAKNVEEMAKLYLEEDEDRYEGVEIREHLPLILHAATVILAMRGIA